MATPAADAAILAALDFTPDAPQCECVRCHHHPDRCDQPAVWFTQVHAIGVCTAPGLAPGGGAVSLVCEPCALVRSAKVTQLVSASHRTYVALGHFMHCASCGRSITDAAMIWEARPL